MTVPNGSEVKNLPITSETQETRVQSLGREDPLQEEMATHSSILAWTIPWTEEPGKLQSKGHEESNTQTRLSNQARTHTCTLEKEGYLIAHSVLTGSGALSSQRMCGCVLVAQSCPTLCDPVDCSPPGSSVHEIFQARVLEWVAISYSRGSSQPRDRTWVS